MIAGVRGKDLVDARSLGVSDVLAIDDDKSIEKFRLVDAIADTVGGDVAAKLIAKVRQGGSFGSASGLPENAAAQNPTVKFMGVLARPDPSKVREFADDVRDGKFVLLLVAGCCCLMRLKRMGRYSCWRRIHNTDFFTSVDGLRGTLPLGVRRTRPIRTAPIFVRAADKLPSKREPARMKWDSTIHQAPLRHSWDEPQGRKGTCAWR